MKIKNKKQAVELMKLYKSTNNELSGVDLFRKDILPKCIDDALSLYNWGYT